MSLCKNLESMEEQTTKWGKNENFFREHKNETQNMENTKQERNCIEAIFKDLQYIHNIQGEPILLFMEQISILRKISLQELSMNWQFKNIAC